MFGWFSEETIQFENKNETSFKDINNHFHKIHSKNINNKINNLQKENFKLCEDIKNLFDKLKIIDIQIKNSQITLNNKITNLDNRINKLEKKMNNCVVLVEDMNN